MQVKGKKKIRAAEVACSAKSLNDGDSFVLDAGLAVYLWVGSKSRKQEVFSANQLLDEIKNERGPKCTSATLDEMGNDEFWSILGGSLDDIQRTNSNDDASDEQNEKLVTRKVFHLCDESGKMQFTEKTPVQGINTKIAKQLLISDDVFILDVESKLFVWVGNRASPNERKFSMKYALQYIENHNRPNWLPIMRIDEGNEPADFADHVQ